MSEGMSRFAAKLRSGDSENYLESGRSWTRYNNIVYLSTGRISYPGRSRLPALRAVQAASRPFRASHGARAIGRFAAK